MSAITDAEFYLSSFGHCHHDPLASKKIIEDLLKELKAESARLDWLDKEGKDEGHGFSNIGKGEYRHYVFSHFNGQVWNLARQVIDRAMGEK